MIKLGAISIVVGVAAFAGCADSTTPTASGVFPSEGFTGRTLRVEISGDATKWKDGATVSFGDGITVNMVDVASPTDLFAEITVDSAAAPGPRDVTVSSGGSFTLKQAFVLKAPVEVSWDGAVAQGSLPKFTITNHDFDNPFDATQAQDPNTGATTYPNLSIVGPQGVDFMSPLVAGGFAVSEFQISGFALVDVDAMSGAVAITSGPSATAVKSQSDSVTVVTRTATPLTAGTAGSGMIQNVNDTALFALPASQSPELVRFATTSTDQNAQPIVAMLGPSGHWADFLGASSPAYTVLPQAGQVYAIVFDGGTEAGYNFSVTGNADQIVVANEPGTPHNTFATAVPASAAPFMLNNATMASATDADHVKFTIPAGSSLIGKHFHVTTTLSPDPFTAVDVNVLLNGTSSITQSGTAEAPDPFNCGFFGQCGLDFTTKPIAAAGTYDFAITADSQSYSTADKQYLFIFWVE